MTRKAPRGELLPWVGVFRALWGQQEGSDHRQVEALEGSERVGAVVYRAHLDARGDVIDNANGLGVCKARQRVRDDMKLHLPWWLCPCLLPIDGFAGGALQAAILERVCW